MIDAEIAMGMDDITGIIDILFDGGFGLGFIDSMPRIVPKRHFKNAQEIRFIVVADFEIDGGFAADIERKPPN